MRGDGREGRRQGPPAPSPKAVGTAVPDTHSLVFFLILNSSVCASLKHTPGASWCPLAGPFCGNYNNSADGDNKMVFTVSVVHAFPLLSHSVPVVPFEM